MFKKTNVQCQNLAYQDPNILERIYAMIFSGFDKYHLCFVAYKLIYPGKLRQLVFFKLI